MDVLQRDRLESYRAIARSLGGACLSSTCGGDREELRWRCALGHEWRARPVRIEDRWCPECAADLRRWRAADAEVSKALSHARTMRGRCLTAVPVASPEPMRWRCAEGHEWTADARSVARGRWCGECHRAWLDRTASTRAKQRAGIPSRWIDERDLARIMRITPTELRERAVGIQRQHRTAGVGYSMASVWHLLSTAQREEARTYASQPRKQPTGARQWIAGYPRLVKEWHPTKNRGLAPESVRRASGRPIWWRCETGHEWEMPPSQRTLNGTGCPYCSGKRASRTNNLATLYPQIAKQWHPTKNGELTARDVTSKSSKRVWWKCAKGPEHEWQATINDRHRAGCPYCAGNRPTSKTNLAARMPELVREWHPTRNRPLTPTQVTAFSGRKVWWRCREGHEWQAVIAGRSGGHGCPYCSGHRVSSTNSLAARAPATARLWHPTKNGALKPRDVTKFSMRRVWWKCPKGADHEWQDTVASQSTRERCVFCRTREVRRAPRRRRYSRSVSP